LIRDISTSPFSFSFDPATAMRDSDQVLIQTSGDRLALRSPERSPDQVGG
jgi:hypothetical protein